MGNGKIKAMKRQFWFAKKRVVGAHGCTKELTALKLVFETGGGLLKVASLSLVRHNSNKTDKTLLMFGFSFLKGALVPLEFFVSGSVVPSCRPAFPVNHSMLVYHGWFL